MPTPRRRYFEVRWNRVTNEALVTEDSDVFAIDEVPSDTEQTLFNELLNIAGRGGDWEWHSSREITQAEYYALAAKS